MGYDSFNADFLDSNNLDRLPIGTILQFIARHRGFEAYARSEPEGNSPWSLRLEETDRIPKISSLEDAYCLCRSLVLESDCHRWVRGFLKAQTPLISMTANPKLKKVGS